MLHRRASATTAVVKSSSGCSLKTTSPREHHIWDPPKRIRGSLSTTGLLLATHYRRTKEKTVTTFHVSSAYARKDVISLFLSGKKKRNYEVGGIQPHHQPFAGYIAIPPRPLSYVTLEKA